MKPLPGPAELAGLRPKHLEVFNCLVGAMAFEFEFLLIESTYIGQF